MNPHFQPESTKRRENKREKIYRFFAANPGIKFGTAELHGKFGPAFRTRVSELNRDPRCPITIKNKIGEGDTSVYWAVSLVSTADRGVASASIEGESSHDEATPPSLFGDLTPSERHRDDG